MGGTSPLGATVLPQGVNFSLFSRTATRVELLFFDRDDDSRPARVIPALRRAYYYWHAFVPGAGAGQLYAYRVWGPSDAAAGQRPDPTKVLLDPYGRGVVVPAATAASAARRRGTTRRPR